MTVWKSRSCRIACSLLMLAGSLWLSGCEGSIFGPSGSGGAPASSSATTGAPGATSTSGAAGTTDPQSTFANRAGFRRLLRREVLQAAAELLGLGIDEAQVIAAGYPNDLPRSSGYVGPRPLQAAAYEGMRDAIEGLTQRASWTKVAGDWAVLCAPGVAPASAEAECATALAQRFARRAFRRPASTTELSELTGAYTNMRADPTDAGYEEALRAVLEVALLSPQLLYNWEQPAEAAEILDGGRAVSGSFQRAARLARLLWGTMPDDQLNTLADAGELMRDEVLAAQAERLLADPRSSYPLHTFVPEWLEVGSLETATKVAAPDGAELSEPLRAAMLREVDGYSAYIAARGATVRGLLTSDVVMANSLLATHYGLPNVTGSDLAPTPAGAAGRVGVLTLGALLASHSGNKEASPTRYGKFVRTRLLCDPVVPPPPGVSTELPPGSNSADLRSRLLEHKLNPACAGCHDRLDPIGFAILEFDHLGRRSFPSADVSGHVADIDTEKSAAFSNVADLARHLGGSAKVRSCFVQQLLRQVTGSEVSPDSPTLAQMLEGAGNDAGDIKQAVLKLATSDWMRFHDPVTQ